MFDAIKKTLLAGVGAAVITKEKADSVFAGFIAQGRLSAADARAMARKLASDGRTEFKAVSRDLEKKVRDLAARGDAATQARIKVLEARLAELEKKQSAKPRSRRTKRSSARDTSA